MESQFGTSSDARRKRVYYTETSTIYEGMPVCYEYDATANILGYDKGAGGDVVCQTTPETTAEGNQNEGKFIRVENPDVDNIDFFAGVVAGTSYSGMTGPRWLDIYIPNGAIVPVRANIECIVGRTILAVQDNVQALGNPTTDIDEFGRDSIGTVVSRPVAIAEETDATLDTTAGIILAKLDPNIFLAQAGMDDEELIVGYGNSTAVNLIVNKSLLDFKNTDGHSCALLRRTRLSGTGSGAQRGVYRFDTLMDATTYGEHVRGVDFSLEVACSASQTTPGHVYGASFMVRTQNSDPDMSGTFLAVQNLEWFLRETTTGVLNNPPAQSVWFRFNADATGTVPSFLFWAANPTSIPITASDGGVSTHKIAISINGTTRYLMVSDG